MKLGWFISLVLISVSVQAADLKPRIVGGEEAALGEFPFIVSLHESGSHICGGSLIKKNWVLTAGHCVSGTRIRKVYLGLHDQNKLNGSEVIAVDQIIRHPNYNTSTTDYDFALIKLKTDSVQQPVDLNAEEISVPPASEPPVMSVTAGWGETRQSSVMGAATRLQKVSVPLVTAEQCRASYGEGAITDRMICAGYDEGGKDACYGDSGGPLVVYNESGAAKLVGVVSWGEGCARSRFYGVYSKVSSVIDWINQTAQ